MRVWEALVARLDHKEPATALAAFRIAVALAVFVTLIPPLWADTVDVTWVDAVDGGYRSLSPRHPLAEWLAPWNRARTHAAIGGALLGGLALLVGLGGRLAALLTLTCLVLLFSLDPAAGGGHDRLHTNALLLLVLAPSTRTLSLDCRLRTGAWQSEELVAAWPRYLAIYQLCLMYCFTGLQKAGPEWTPMGGFMAVYYALLKPIWQRFPPMDWVAWVTPLTQVGTVWTWVFEAGAPVWLLALYFRSTRERPGRLRAWSNRVDLRSLWALMGVVLHLQLWVWMELGPFQAVTLAYYTCLWHPDEYRRLLRG